MSRIRVLRIIARMNVGGPALQITGLMRGLDPERFDHRLLVGNVEEGEADYLELRAPDVEVVRLPELGRSVRAGGDLRAYRRIRQEVRRFRPHIVHTHTAKAGVLGRLAARGSGARRVHTFHGHLLHGYFGRAGTAAVVGVERVLARSTDRLVAVGGQVRDDLLAAGIGCPDQYVVVPPGVALPPVPDRLEARAALGLPADGPVVVFVARLTQIKRPDRFVEVAAKVLQARPDAVFAVAGEGPLLETMRAQAAPLGRSVRFLGWRGDVETVYGAADLTLLTSDNEGMPLSLIEAALCGVPAVTPAVGSAAEVVLDGQTGTVTPPEVPALAEAVLDLLSDPQRLVRWGEAAREHAELEFGVDRLVDEMEILYEELVR